MMIPFMFANDPNTPAIEALDGWFHNQFAELPLLIQARAEADVFLPVAELWDRWSAEDRRAIYRDPNWTPPIDGPLWEHPDDVALSISTWTVEALPPLEAQETPPAPAIQPPKKHTRNRNPDLKDAYRKAYALASHTLSSKNVKRQPNGEECMDALRELVGDADCEVLIRVTDTHVHWKNPDTDLLGKVAVGTVINAFSVIRKGRKPAAVHG